MTRHLPLPHIYKQCMSHTQYEHSYTRHTHTIRTPILDTHTHTHTHTHIGTPILDTRTRRFLFPLHIYNVSITRGGICQGGSNNFASRGRVVGGEGGEGWVRVAGGVGAHWVLSD